jgi:hypothetical protein
MLVGALASAIHYAKKAGELRSDFEATARISMQNESMARSLRREVDDGIAAQRKASADCDMLIDQRNKLVDELAVLRTPRAEPPKAPLQLCTCGESRSFVLKHHIGWRKGKPEPLGALIQCIRCGLLWDVDESGMERAREVTPAKPGKPEKPKPKDDSDLRWGNE